ncbi:MAG: hypothetical protein IJB48_03040 [Clostridia bacterium]|nr:hypothetical protein [Clostridia bacterium]
MKKLISLFGVIAVLLALSTSVFAGSIPESLLGEDGAKVFIGTVENFTTKSIEGSSQVSIETVEVIPTKKIKGEVEIGVKETYTRCDSVLTLEKGKEYLFGYIDENNFYIYDIKSRDEKSIKLVDADKYDMTKRFEDYLNEGAFTMAEQERSTLGKQISFAEFLYKKPSLSSSPVEKVSFLYQGKHYEVDKEPFFQIAEEIMVTGAKNEMLYETQEDAKTSAPYETVLYIELLDANDKMVYYGAVSRFGEVDHYGLFMSRLMQKDYEMNTEDVSKLYSLLPADVQKEMKMPESLPVSAANLPTEPTDEPVKDSAGWIVGGVALIAAIVCASVFMLRKNHK